MPVIVNHLKRVLVTAMIMTRVRVRTFDSGAAMKVRIACSSKSAKDDERPNP